jgi:Ca-activated chloride channel family protein
MLSQDGTVMRPLVLAAVALLAVSLHGQPPPPASQAQNPDTAFRFKSGVELINVTATVVDANGRFVPGLRQEDFLVYEDNQPQTVTHFSADHVPVSLGIALDTSQSMSGEKIDAAKAALDRFLSDLFGPEDEFFLYRFSDGPVLLQTWTRDRGALSRALNRVVPTGRTAMFDTIADAVPLVQAGRNRKKALVVISDGVDTTSTTTIREAKQLIHESEALVYAVGIDCGAEGTDRVPRLDPRPQRGPVPIPFPLPPGRRPGFPPPPPQPNGRVWLPRGCTDPVDVAALRDLTDDSGGRTEIIRQPRDLEPATSGIADELSKQYYLGYPASGKRDGRWHSIRVELKNGAYRVRARRGYVAS